MTKDPKSKNNISNVDNFYRSQKKKAIKKNKKQDKNIEIRGADIFA